jgi:PAS domain S-box-containing protein
MTMNSPSGVTANGSESRDFWFDGVGIPVFAVDTFGNITAWNRKAGDCTGFSAEEVRSRPLASFVDPCRRQAWEEALSEGLAGKREGICEISFRDKDVAVSTFRVRIACNRLASGDIDGAVCFLEEMASVPRSGVRSPPTSEESMGSSTAMSLNGGHAEPPQECSKSVPSVSQEKEHQLFVNGLSVPAFCLEPDGVLSGWNQKMSDLTGYEVKKILGINILEKDFLPKTFLENFRRLNHCDDANVRVEFPTEKGKPLSLLFSPSLQTFADSGSAGVIVIVQDLTELAKYEDAARELGQLIETVNLPILGIDTDGNITLWNQKISEISGFPSNEITGECIFGQFTVPSLQKSVRSVLESALKGNETCNYELEFKAKAGDIRYFLANVMTRKDANDQVMGAIIVAQDVTEAAQHDRAVAGMARELRQLVDTANAPIFGVDDTGKVNEWNDKTVEITGYSVDEAFNKQFVDTFISAEHRVSVQSVLDSALKGRGTTNFELEICTRSNEVRYLLVNAATRRDAENNIVGAVAIAQDVTEASKHDRAVAAMASELRQLIDTANAPIFGIDCDGYVKWSPKVSLLVYTRILTRFLCLPPVT